MNLFRQVHLLARQLMAQGLDRNALREGLREALPALNLKQKSRLASLINREFMILGHAAHDPNLYRNCATAKQAKQNSPDAHLKLLTYQTPLCTSCAYNRSGNCSLMGGRLVSGPEGIPEIAVQRTADILRTEGRVSPAKLGRVAASKASPADRLVILHQHRLDATDRDPRKDIQAQSNSRLAAAILDPSPSFDIKPKKLTGPSRAVNNEDVTLDVVDDTTDRRGSRLSSRVADMMEPADMRVEVPYDPPRRTSPLAEVEPYTATTTLPKEEHQATPDLDEDNAIQAQKALFKLAKKASLLLSQGVMTTRAATLLYQRMDAMEQHGANHNSRTAAIKNQLDVLSGGLQL
jgi:hypothetical protein